MATIGCCGPDWHPPDDGLENSRMDEFSHLAMLAVIV
jgi:hypothetical protein